MSSVVHLPLISGTELLLSANEDLNTVIPVALLSSCSISLYFDRNKMVEYLTDWVMGTSNQAADDDIKCLTRYSFFFFWKKLKLRPFLQVQFMIS